jgi:hypothetical protein
VAGEPVCFEAGARGAPGACGVADMADASGGAGGTIGMPAASGGADLNLKRKADAPPLTDTVLPSTEMACPPAQPPPPPTVAPDRPYHLNLIGKTRVWASLLIVPKSPVVQ